MFGAGFLAGIVNTLAGGASIFTLSTLLFFGLPAGLANGTNRLGILLQNFAGTYTFMKNDLLDMKSSTRFVVPSLIGAILGAVAAVEINEELLELVVGLLMTGVLFLVLFNPKRKYKIGSKPQSTNRWANLLLFFAIGFYGGFVQAGIGIVILVALFRGSNYSLLKGNAVKMLIIFLYTVPVFFIFVYNDQVAWVFAILLAVGQIAGTWFTGKFLVQHPKANLWVRWVLIMMIVFSIIKSFRRFFYRFGIWFNQLTVDINKFIEQINQGISNEMREAIVLLVLVFVIISLFKEYIRPALTFLIANVVLICFGIITPTEWLNGFSNQQIATIILLILITAVLRKNFNVEEFFDQVFRKARNGRAFLIRMCGYVAFLSSFLNNTPVVAFMTPYVYGWTKRFGIHPSKLLMPLSFATILGGMITVLGTSTNLILNGFLVENGIPVLKFTDFFYLGLLVTVVGIAYLYTLGYKLLPENREAFDDFKEKAPEYTVETHVMPRSKFIGRTIQGSGLNSLKSAYLIELIREGKTISPIPPDEKICPHDVLIFIGKPDAIMELVNADYGLRLPTNEEEHHEILEAVVPANSPLAGRSHINTIIEERFNGKIIAMHRNGEKISGQLDNIKLVHGDMLLLSVGESALKHLDGMTDLYILSKIDKNKNGGLKNGNKLFLGTLGLILLLALLKIVSLFTALIFIMVSALVLKMFGFKDIKKHLDIDLIVLLVSALVLGNALIKTGAADLVANTFIEILLPLGRVTILIGLFVMTVALTSFVTNVAAVSIMFPIAYSVCQQMGVSDGTPFYITIAFAASAAFITPVSYQTNWMVYGPGGYKSKDFLRVGSPLLLLYATTCLLFIVFYYGIF